MNRKTCSRNEKQRRGDWPVAPTRVIVYFLWLAVISFSILSSASAQTPPTIIPISVNGEGEWGNGDSWQPLVSTDGRFVYFTTQANNLTEDASDAPMKTVLLDRESGETPLISVTSSGEALSDNSAGLAVSGNGRFLLFKTIEGDSIRSQKQLYLYDQISQGATPLHILGVDQQPVLEIDDLSISEDGRFVAFDSESSRLVINDRNGVSDIFIYDRLTQKVTRASVNGKGDEANAPSTQPRISADGRMVVFTSEASNLVVSDTNERRDVFLYNRVLAEISRVSVTSSGGQAGGDSALPSLSASGGSITFTSDAENLAGDFAFIHDTSSHKTEPIKTVSMPVDGILSADGHFFVYGLVAENGSFNLFRKNLGENTDELIAENMDTLGNVSADGSAIAFTKIVEGMIQSFIWDEDGEMQPSFVLAGRVTDETGHPLALVTIQDGRGEQVRTDGNGYFWINGIRPGPVTLTPFKEGFVFEPGEISLEAQSDIQNIAFTYAHDETLQEAQLDLGMPYNFDRGAEGPFHGFSAGYCTDLILDAYTWGVDFNIDFALEQDFKARPWHFYRWRDARNAHDMWRYFSYSGQMLPHEAAYLPGDIVFFDWSEDGEIDHVSIVSEATSAYRPRKLYDATGVIDLNPGGLAAELTWEPIHERTVRGHARWSGKYEPITPELPSGQNLQMALSSPGLTARLLDKNGMALSAGEHEISGGLYADWVWEQTLSVLDSFSEESIYLLVVTNPEESEIPYQFAAQFIQDGLVSGRVELKGRLIPKEMARYPLLVQLDENGKITIQLGNANRRIEGAISLTHP